MLTPQARLAAVLSARERPLVCEELTLRARLDLDHGRGREAALQLLVALDAALAELQADPAADALARPARPSSAPSVSRSPPPLRRRSAASSTATELEAVAFTLEPDRGGAARPRGAQRVMMEVPSNLRASVENRPARCAQVAAGGQRRGVSIAARTWSRLSASRG